MNLTYREAGPEDAASLAEVGAKTFVETFGHLYRTEDLSAFLRIHTAESWAGELADPALKVLLVEDEAGRPVAYAKVGPRSLPYEPDCPALELRQFYVLQPWQGAGIAPRLMDWVLGQAKARQAGEICLSVWTENERAKRFYTRYGFSYVGPYRFMVGEQADEDEIWRLKVTARAGRHPELGSGSSPALPDRLQAGALAGIAHGFLGRRGGVSQGVCAGLNVGFGSDDDPAAIQANRRLAVEAVVPGAKLVTVHQVHSATALVAEAEPWPDDARPPADAIVTDRPGLALGILTADCAPVLFADAAAGIVGAAHAGWKGALGGIVESTIAAMEKLGANRARIAAAVGPCIARRSYEVDDNFLRRFVEQDPGHERFFAGGREGHYQFDLEAFVISRLAASGLGRVEALGQDTYSQPERFYSFRRATHRGEPDYGRQISIVAL